MTISERITFMSVGNPIIESILNLKRFVSVTGKSELATISNKSAYGQHITGFVEVMKSSTGYVYKRDVEIFLNDVEEITLRSTLAYFQKMVDDGYSESSIMRRKAALSEYFNYLVDLNILDKNYFATKTFKKMVKKIRQEATGTKGNKPPAKHLDWGEVMKMIDACGFDGTVNGERNKVIVYLGVYCGLRRSEIANLEWRDIQEAPQGTLLDIRKAKGGTGQVKLHKTVKNAIMILKETYEKHNQFHDNKISLSDNDPVVISTANRNYGKKLTGNAINEIVKKISKVAKVTTITAHDLRHTCAVELLNRNNEISKVAKHLRHKNIQTTMTYTKTAELMENNPVDCLP